MHHKIPVRIYYEDTDAGGIVYHANYLKFAERGRTEFLRNCGFLNSQLEKDQGFLFVVRHIDVDYLKPAYLDDELVMHSSILDLKNSSFVMQQSLYRKDELVCDLRVVLVCVDSKKHKPVRLPETIKEAFQNRQDSVS